MHSGKRDLPYTNSHFPAKPTEFLSPSWDAAIWGEKTNHRRTKVAEEGWASRHPEHPSSNTSPSESSFGCDAPLQFCCNDGSEPNAPRWTLQAAAQRAFSTPTTRCSQWCSQLRRIGEPGLDTLTTGSALFLFFLSLEIFSPVRQWSWPFCYNKLSNSTP